MLEVLRDGEKDLTGNTVRELGMITALGAEQRDKELQAEDAAVCIVSKRGGSKGMHQDWPLWLAAA